MTTTATRCAIYAVLTIPLWTGACARDVTDDGVDPVPYFEMSDNMMGTVIRSSARADVGKKVTFVGLKSGQPKVVLRAGWTSPLQKMYKDYTTLTLVLVASGSGSVDAFVISKKTGKFARAAAGSGEVALGTHAIAWIGVFR